MSTHPRQDIRHALKTILLAANTAADENVYPCRKTSLWESEELPAICVYTARETAAKFSEAPRRYERTVQASIEAIVQGSTEEEVEDALDAIALEIEDLMDDNRYLVIDVAPEDAEEPQMEAQAADSTLIQSSSEIKKEGEKFVGGIVLVYQIIYYTDSPSGISSLGDPQDLKSAGITYKVSPSASDNDQLHDEIEGLDDA